MAVNHACPSRIPTKTDYNYQRIFAQNPRRRYIDLVSKNNPLHKIITKMKKAGISKQTPDQFERRFQPGALIVAEIAFAALLLYLIRHPVDFGEPMQADIKPAITIEIPAVGVAIASTAVPVINSAPARRNNCKRAEC